MAGKRGKVAETGVLDGGPGQAPSRVPTHMMLALWTAVTLERPFLVAKSKANLAMRCDLARVMIFMHSMTPLELWAWE